MKKEKVYFQNTKGLSLCGVLSEIPDSDTAILICHGYTSNKDRPVITNIEKVLEDKYTTFRFDYSGIGESEGCDEDLILSQEIDDLLSAIDFLKQKKYKKFGIVARSFSGTVAVVVANKEPNIKLMIFWSCPIDYTEHIENTETKETLIEWEKIGYKEYVNRDGVVFHKPYDLYNDVQKYNGWKFAKNIGVPILILHGTVDDDVSVNQAKKLNEVVKGSRIELFENENHQFSDGASKKALFLIREFVDGILAS